MYFNRGDFGTFLKNVSHNITVEKDIGGSIFYQRVEKGTFFAEAKRKAISFIPLYLTMQENECEPKQQ